MNFHKIFKENRKRLGYTQEDISIYLNVTPQAVSKWETGQGTPDLSLIVPIAQLFNITTDELLGRSDMPLDSTLDEIYNSFQQSYRVKYDKCKDILKNNPFNEEVLLRLLSLSAEWLSSAKDNLNAQEKEELVHNAKDFSKRLQKSQTSAIYTDASGRLADNYIAARYFEQAKEEIEKLPKSCRYTQKRMLANLALIENKLDQSLEFYRESFHDTIAFLLWDIERIAQCYGNMLHKDFKTNRSKMDKVYKIEYDLIHAIGTEGSNLLKNHLCNASIRLAQKAIWSGDREKTFEYLDEFVSTARALQNSITDEITELSPVLPRNLHPIKSLNKNSILFRLSWNAFNPIRTDIRFQKYLEEINSWN